MENLSVLEFGELVRDTGAVGRPIHWIVCAVMVVCGAGCAGSSEDASRPALAAPSTPAQRAPPLVAAASAGEDEVLAIAGLGRFYGSCPYRGSFALRLSLDSAAATDVVSYRIGNGPPRHLQVNPGRTARIDLPAIAVKLRNSDQIRATPLVSLRVEQPTEPHTIMLRARLRLAQSRDGTQRCLLIGTDLRSRVYYSDGGPPL